MRCFLKEAESRQTGRVPTRKEVPIEDTWDLTPLFETDAAWDEEFAAVAKEYANIANFTDVLSKSPQGLRDTLEFQKNIDQRIEKLNQYAALRVAEDSSNADSLAREAKLQALLTRIGEAFSFVIPAIQSIPDTDFEAWLKMPELAEWIVPLKKIRRQKPHTLTPGEERLLALGASVMSGHGDTFSQLTNVDMRFGEIEIPGEGTRELTQSSFSSFLVRREAEVRKAAFHKFYKEFADHQYTLASTLANSVRSDVFYARARNFPSSIEASLFQDDVPVAVYENLIRAVRENFEPLFRYFELRKQALGLKELHHYDTYVPIVADVQTRISWDEAVEKVIASLTPLGDEYCKVLREGLTTRRWCDRYENKGKRSGAFSYGTYSSPPYIMMNYKEDVFADVFTLAHEAGHSMHTWYAREAQPYQTYHYPIFLAEVASTFNEILLTEHLLATETNPAMRAFLINRQIDDFRGTLYRQTMFAEFEKQIHEVEEAGDALTLDTFREIYRGLLSTYFGDAVVIDEELSLECLRIPHFYNAFYVYKYATGLSAAVALARNVLTSGDADAYLEFLKVGGSRFPLDALREAGVDMTSPEPVRAALALFADRVEELESLLA
jgi:oligoendopeptidase F